MVPAPGPQNLLGTSLWSGALRPTGWAGLWSALGMTGSIVFMGTQHSRFYNDTFSWMKKQRPRESKMPSQQGPVSRMCEATKFQSWGPHSHTQSWLVHSPWPTVLLRPEHYCPFLLGWPSCLPTSAPAAVCPPPVPPHTHTHTP